MMQNSCLYFYFFKFLNVSTSYIEKSHVLVIVY